MHDTATRPTSLRRHVERTGFSETPRAGFWVVSSNLVPARAFRIRFTETGHRRDKTAGDQSREHRSTQLTLHNVHYRHLTYESSDGRGWMPVPSHRTCRI